MEEEQNAPEKKDWGKIIGQSAVIILVFGIAIQFMRSERKSSMQNDAIYKKLNDQADSIYRMQKSIDEYLKLSNARIADYQEQVTIVEKQQPINITKYYEKIVTLRPDSTIAFAFDTSRAGFYRDLNSKHEVYFPKYN